MSLRYTGHRVKSLFEAGNNYLPISLQRIEADIFIQNILKRLYKEKLTVLSKHDSILCKYSEADIVEIIMKEELDRIFDAGNYFLRKKLITESSSHKQEAA